MRKITKLFAGLLASAMVLTMSTAVFASAEEKTSTSTYTDHETVTIQKKYKLTNEGTISPAETFTLEQVGAGRVTDGEATSAPALGTITGAAYAVGGATTAGAIEDITVNLPVYESVGIYEYTLKEVAGTTAGVTYYGNNIKLVVTVIQGDNGKLRVAAVHTEDEDGTKSDTFENIYSAGQLNVSKTAIFTKREPLSVAYGMGIEEHDKEGRVITLEFPEFYFITVYTPNSQSELRRLEYRMEWEKDFLAYLLKLQEKKPVICCGDLNVAHQEIDLKNPKTNRKNAGFTDEERGCFTRMIEVGFIDTFRFFYPDKEGIYSWWSYRFKAREKNAGWRIDYFITSLSLKENLKDAVIHTEIMGSDHCPVELDIDFEH